MADEPQLVSDRAPHRASVVTIGTYDGVHLGHRHLIEQARNEGRERDLPVVVVTFDRHPLSIVRPASTPELLSSLDQKLELLRSTGVDEIIVLHFDANRARESAEDFVTSTLVGELGARVVYVGATFRFGHGHRGDLKLLGTLGKQLGFEAKGVELVTDESQSIVSSTRIRALIRDGALDEAATLLGRPHEVRGVLTELSGSQYGALGVIVDAGLCMPPAGVYEAVVGAPGGVGEKLTVRVIKDDDDPSASAEVVIGVPDTSTGDGRPEIATGARYGVSFSSRITRNDP